MTNFLLSKIGTLSNERSLPLQSMLAEVSLRPVIHRPVRAGKGRLADFVLKRQQVKQSEHDPAASTDKEAPDRT